MMRATINGIEITGKTIAEIKRKASTIANRNNNAIDEMIVEFENLKEGKFMRFNRKFPDNSIIRGQWR